MRRSHTISTIKTKQPIVLLPPRKWEGIRARGRGKTPFEKEIETQKYHRPSGDPIETIFLPALRKTKSIGCKLAYTHTHTHTRLGVRDRRSNTTERRRCTSIVAVAGRKGGICLTTSLLYNLPRGNGGGGGSAVYD